MQHRTRRQGTGGLGYASSRSMLVMILESGEVVTQRKPDLGGRGRLTGARLTRP